MTFRLPSDTDRITIIGKTGSGKTQGAAWLLSLRSWKVRPWVIIDFKRDDLLNSIPGLKRLDIKASIPSKPGLYIVHPNPGQDEEVEDFLWKVWAKEHTGLYLDEGYMIPARSAAYQAILTQGRSKHIPLMTLTQRPAWLSRFAFSEADFIQLYKLTDVRDLKIVKQFVPLSIEKPLPAAYYSYWYDNAANYGAVLSPVPDKQSIIGNFSKVKGKIGVF